MWSALCVMAVLSAQTPAPTSAAELFALATRHAEDLEYDQAASLLQEVIVADDADDALRMRARLSLGKVEVIRGRLAEARLHYLWALRKNRDLTLGSDEPPKVRGFFQSVKEEFATQNPPPAAAGPEDEAEDGPPWAVVAGGVAAGAVVLAAVATTATIAGVLIWQAQPSLGVYDLSNGE